MIRGMHTTCRPLEPSDQAFIIELNDDPVVRQNVVGWDFPSSLHNQMKWYESNTPSQTQRWLVTDASGTSIGLTGLWDIDWRNRNALTAIKLGGPSQSRGRGLGTDAIMSVMAYAFYEVGLERLYSTVLSCNAASMGAYVKHCGWSVEGTARQHVWRGGRLTDLVHIGVLKSEFESHPDSVMYRKLLDGEF